MNVISLQSGSNGNCIYVEADGVRLLIDAGISGKQAAERLAQHGRDIRDVDAVLISHDHVDHACSMGIFHRKFGVPVYLTAATHRAAKRHRPGDIKDRHYFAAGEILQFGDVRVETVATPHDGADGVVFIIDDGEKRLGVLTDLGHVFAGLDDVVGSLDAVLLESNYDPEMLAGGHYPAWLKERIRGPHGHLSNGESADLLRRSASSRLKWACLAHLSQDNNTPETALQTHHRTVGDRFPIHVATRYGASDVLKV